MTRPRSVLTRAPQADRAGSRPGKGSGPSLACPPYRLGSCEGSLLRDGALQLESCQLDPCVLQCEAGILELAFTASDGGLLAAALGGCLGPQVLPFLRPASWSSRARRSLGVSAARR